MTELILLTLKVVLVGVCTWYIHQAVKKLFKHIEKQ